jgi:alkaline phosphatase D
MRRVVTFLTVPLVVACFVPQARAETIPEWMWSGAVTTRSAVVKAKLSPGAAKVRLLVAEDGQWAKARSFPASGTVQPDRDGIVAFELRGLEPDTSHQYVIEAGGQRGPVGRLRTFADGPQSFRIAHGSCATTGSSHRIFTTIRELDPLLFLHLGDFHYENIKVNDPARYRRAFDQVLASRTQSALYRSVPIAYVWDDHDFGPNDADRTTPGRPAALAAYQQCVPHYPLVRHAGRVETIQQAFTIGRVRFLLTDGRAARDPVDTFDGPGKSMLGEAQRAWLFEELEAAVGRYAVVVWVNPVPWITKSQPRSSHGWEPYSFERGLIADRIKQLGLVNRLLIVSGDGHMLALDDGTNSNYATDRRPGEAAFPVFQAAPLDRFPRVKGGPYSHGVVARKRLFGLLKEKQFGLLQVTDDGEVLEVHLSGHDSEGTPFPGMDLRMRCEADGCRPIS